MRKKLTSLSGSEQAAGRKQTGHFRFSIFPLRATVPLALCLLFGEAIAQVPGSTFRDSMRSGGGGPLMVVVPAGTFMMGCVSGRECVSDELPVHEVEIARSFALSVHEVTFEDYDRFTYADTADDEGWGRGGRPVINVSWAEAERYTRWLSDQTGHKYRLPSEAEWEYAARAGSATMYSWGDDVGWGRANCKDCGSRWDDKRRTAPVGSFAPNGFGLYDMHGNVWEWVQDCWNGDYAGAPTDGTAWLQGDCGSRVLRGGSWVNNPGNLRAANRSRCSTGSRCSSNGFRVARTLTP